MAETQKVQQTQTTATAEPSPLEAAIEATPSRAQSITERTAAFLGVPRQKVFDVLRGIWKPSKSEAPLTNSELMIGMALVARYDLDPFAREIYVTRSKGKAIIIIGVDGWIRILDRTDHYDGFEQTMQWNEGKLESVTTTIYSKTRKVPSRYTAYADEYAKICGPVAGVIPWHMLRIFSLRQTCRFFTPIAGAMTQEEAAFLIHGSTDDGSPTPRTLDDLTEKLTAEPEPASTPEPSSADADRAILLDDYASEFARQGEIGSVAVIDDLWSKVLASVAGGYLTEHDKAALAELANAAKAKVTKV